MIARRLYKPSGKKGICLCKHELRSHADGAVYTTECVSCFECHGGLDTALAKYLNGTASELGKK